ncbi:MAG: mannosyltransferase family protein [Microgenomates group bacterium]
MTNKTIFIKILKLFTIWRVALFIIAFISTILITKFGARFPYFDRVLEITNLPSWIWGFGNFDGVHYLRIAQNGYTADYSQAFFPLFPSLINIVSNLFPRVNGLDLSQYTDPAFFYSGIIVSNLFLFAALFVYYKLVSIDFGEKVANLSTILLLVFPTSFFLGAIYSEGLFLFLAMSSIYLMRKSKFLLASVVIMIATATRLAGLFLIVVYLIEVYKSKNKINYLWVIFTPLGILAYMYFLHLNFGNAFYFFSSSGEFGTGRDVSRIILFPQIIYRYIKMFVSTDIFSLTFLNITLEFLFTLGPLVYLLTLIKKMRPSYWIFSLFTLLIGTLNGTFTSMPRYIIPSMIFIFPFIALQRKIKLNTIFVASGLLMIALTMLFVRGYWVA